MTTPIIKIKVFPKTSIKGKMDVRFPAKVETENFLTVTRANGVYTLGIDYTLLTDVPIINPSTAMVVVLDKSAGIYKLQSVAELATDLPANSVTYSQIQQVGANKLLGNPTGSTANVSEISIGTGIATALGVNVGTAGAPVINGGVLGTPSSGTATNLTGLPISTGVSGLATGVATFLATPSSANLRAALTDEVGTGAAYFIGGALGTPASGTATNLTGLPLSTGISGAGTGVLTALGVNVGTAGSIVVNGGALGTPSSGTLTSATGLPISTGVSGLGTGIATALAINVGTAGSPVVNGGALGTPSSGVGTNLTGTAAGLTAGHVTTNANLTGDVTSVGNATTLATGNAGNLNSGTLLAARMPALTGDVTTTAGAVATTIGANKVTNAMHATMAAFTFKGNNTSGAATPTDIDISLLTAKASPASTDLVIISDQAASGAWKKVSISALASAGSVASIGGNTGAFTLSNGITNSANDIRLADDFRQSILLDRIYQSKLFAGYRRVINSFADGYKASDGVNSGGSANFSVDTTNGKVTLTPTFTIQTPSAVTTTFTFTASGGAAEAHLFDGNDTTPAADPGGLTSSTAAAYDFGTAQSIRHLRIITAPASGGFTNSPTMNIQYSDTSLTAGFTTADTIVIPAGLAQVVQKDIADNGSHRYWRIIYASGTTGGNAWLGELSFSTLNDGLVATTAQTSDATVSNAKVLIEYDNAATPALNSDLIAEVTCDGGSHWTAASLSSVSSHSQGSRSVAETVDQACTGGTSFAARIRDHANKTIPVYGLSLVVH